MDLNSLSLALGSSFTAGVNIYLTVFSLGLMHRYDALTLPSKLEILGNPWIIGIFGLLTLAEFIVDKVPGAATIWDYLHGPLRIMFAAGFGAASFADVSTEAAGLAGLAGGAVGSTSFLGNRSVREAAKAAPGTGSILSLGKEGISVSVLWFAANHPYLAVVLVLVLLALCVVAIYYFFRLLKRIVRKVSEKLSRKKSEKERSVER